jgi:23S rRNA (adenine2503-C2)-methyltransferase
MNVKKFTDGNIVKYVFVKDDACYEAVLYKYPTYNERTVLCISTQCGCPVGCTFCGTGKRFVRNLTSYEIKEQVEYIYYNIGRIISEGTGNYWFSGFTPKKEQIMFMSMGEPFLNYSAVRDAIRELNEQYPNADLLVSSIAPDKQEEFNDFLNVSAQNDKIGLQFSIHEAVDYNRNQLIPFKAKMNLREIRDYGIQWYATTGRKVYLNYCINGSNNAEEDANKLFNLFSPTAFAFTFSVICSADESMKDAGYRNIESIEEFQDRFIKLGYDTRIFNPDGQDSVGGGCGQLWYVQNWMQNRVTVKKNVV